MKTYGKSHIIQNMKGLLNKTYGPSHKSVLYQSLLILNMYIYKIFGMDPFVVELNFIHSLSKLSKITCLVNIFDRFPLHLVFISFHCALFSLLPFSLPLLA
jgi:hypothetical protein